MAPQRTRRLAAVWFADIVGYTQLSSRDEDAALAIVDELQSLARAAVEEGRGRIVKFQGDAVLAVFDSTDGALKAALQLQDDFSASETVRERGCALRVGAHVGEVVEAEDGDIYGDGVNLASRIEGVAEPGQVVISSAVQQQVRQRAEFRLDPLKPTRVKGVESPLELYAVSIQGAPARTLRAVRTDRARRAAAGVGIAAGTAAFIALSVFVAGRGPAEPSPVLTATEASTLEVVIPPEMVLVPAGTYPIGRVGSGDFAAPEHTVELDAFAIERTEVSVGEYADFVEAGLASAPWTNRPASQLPVTGVFWGEASSYCAWRFGGGMLPTEQQWEAAARPTGQRYPWGDEPRVGMATTGSSGRGAPVPVASSTTEPDSIADMIGNVWEWTRSQMRAYPGGRAPEGGEQFYVIRGGAFDTPDDIADASYRGYLTPTTTDRSDYQRTGFRCALPLTPSPSS